MARRSTGGKAPRKQLAGPPRQKTSDPEAVTTHSDELNWSEDELCGGGRGTTLVIDGHTRQNLYEIDDAVDQSRDGARPNTYGFQHSSDPSDTGRYVDMQGVNWPNFEARENYVAERFADERMQAFHNIDHGPDGDLLKVLERDYNTFFRPDPQAEPMFQFSRFSRQASPCHFHFQLRNLLVSASAFEYYYLERNKIMLFNAASDSSSVFLDAYEDKRDAVRKCSDLIISTMCTAEDLLMAGGFNGEVILTSLLSDGVASMRVDGTGHESNIVNAAEICRSPSGEVQLVLATNCNSVCMHKAEGLSMTRKIDLNWPANYASACPTDPKMLAIVGDDCSGKMFDLSSKTQITELKGHLDYCFAVAWHPEGNQFVTGSQDKTFRVWDPRYMSKSLDVIKCTHAEVRSLKYSPNGKFLAVAEPHDTVNVYDTCFKRQQKLSFFASISGVTFSTDSSTLMLALNDALEGGLVEFIASDCPIYTRHCANNISIMEEAEEDYSDVENHIEIEEIEN